MENIGKVIGKYKLTQVLGEGGMAKVYEGVHETLGKKVAIKILNPILSANAQIRERFKNEATLMASLQHPNIVDIIDFVEEPNLLAIIMELLDGDDLNDYIKQNGAFNVTEITALFSQVLDAFAFAHNNGIVHRDVKPSNIFILKNKQIKILDFGIAKLFGTGLDQTKTGTQMGTPLYMSPEQVKADKSIDHRSDIYSLGVTLYYMVSGKPPYNDQTESGFDIQFKIVKEIFPEYEGNEKINLIIQKATAKNRDERFQSCVEFIDQIKSDNYFTKFESTATKEFKKGVKNIEIIKENKKHTSTSINDHKQINSNLSKNKLFSFYGRMRRSEFVAYNIVTTIMVTIGVFLVDCAWNDGRIFGMRDNIFKGEDLLVYIAIGLAILGTIFSFALSSKRLHDINKSGWIIIFAFIPIVGIIMTLFLIFKEGTKGPNKYGPDPKGRN